MRVRWGVEGLLGEVSGGGGKVEGERRWGWVVLWGEDWAEHGDEFFVGDVWEGVMIDDGLCVCIICKGGLVSLPYGGQGPREVRNNATGEGLDHIFSWLFR